MVKTHTQHRKSADVDPSNLAIALQSLPCAVVGHGGKGFYPNKDFKRVPSWAKASRFVPCLSKVVELSNGLNVKHVPMRQAVDKFQKDAVLDLNADQIDDTAYSLRAIIAQLQNI
eukprot:7995757-Pyramimonas_sp.AAC.1